MSSQPSDRFTPGLAWDTLTVDQWHALVAAMIKRNDIEAVPGVLVLMATHGYAREAEDLRQLMLRAAVSN